MKIHQETIEALLNHCNPVTGELCDDKILYEASVRNMLEWALEQCSAGEQGNDETVFKMLVSNEQIEEVRLALKNQGMRPSSALVTKFLLGSKASKFAAVQNHPFFECIDKKHRNLLRVLVDDYFDKHVEETYAMPEQDHLFFRSGIYNNLSDKAVIRLQELIAAIGIVKRPDELSPAVQKIRKEHFRSHEPWTAHELELLKTALSYTNDLEFLSKTFQRGKNAMYLKSLLFLDGEEE